MMLRNDLEYVGIDAPYYYKTQGITYNATPVALGGPVKAPSANEAMDRVLELSKGWNVASLQAIAIYEIDEFGVLPEDPILVENNPNRGQLQLPAPSHDVRKPTVHDEWAEASWCKEIKTTTVFPTVKLNEDDDNEHTRSRP
jgi:hypothetical protein